MNHGRVSEPRTPDAEPWLPLEGCERRLRRDQLAPPAYPSQATPALSALQLQPYVGKDERP